MSILQNEAVQTALIALIVIGLNALVIWGTWYAYPNGEGKVLQFRMLPPIESPDAVRLTWVNGMSGRTYTLYAKEVRIGAEWFPLATGLPPNGSFTWPQFTLDRDWDYMLEMEEEP